MEKNKEFVAFVNTLLYLKTCSFQHLNKEISAKFLTFLEIAIYCARPCAI